MPDILHSFLIDAPPERVWPALTSNEGVGGWWSIGHTQLDGDPGSLGAFLFRSRAVSIRIQVTALQPHDHVGWRPIEANAPGGWTGTTISFDLRSEGDGTRLDFAHRGFAEDNEGYRLVTGGWAQYLQNLKEQVETTSP